jgi:hypothetical protein
MVEKFSYVTDSGIALRLNLEIGGNLFDGNDKSEISSFYKSDYSGVRWESSGRIISMMETGRSVYGRPTPDMKRVVVVYPYDHPVYSSPNNAVVYNADGSIHMQLKAPKLISDLAKQQARFIHYKGGLSLFFNDVDWKKNSDGKVVVAVSFGFNRDWHEERELNPETGEFGECLDSGRR